MTDTLSFEEFETAHRRNRFAGTGPPVGKGPNQVFLRRLKPLTPTRVPRRGRPLETARSGIFAAWHGTPTSAVKMRDEKGGSIKTVVLSNKTLWVTWYPKDSDFRGEQ